MISSFQLFPPFSNCLLILNVLQCKEKLDWDAFSWFVRALKSLEEDPDEDTRDVLAALREPLQVKCL